MSLLRVTSLKVGLLILCLPPFAQAQHERWQRVFTGDEFFVDIDPASLIFEPHILRARFRTVFSKTEAISKDSVTRYKTRLETIEFQTGKRYRYYETTLLNPAGKIVQSYSSNSSAWKIFRPGGITERLFDAARGLSPMGLWKIVAYRFAEGESNSATDAPELSDLVGTLVRLDVDAAEVGTERCSSPSFESHQLADKGFYERLGISLASLGLSETQAASIIVKCESHEWAPPQSLILPLPSGEILMLWKGVFLELKRRRR